MFGENPIYGTYEMTIDSKGRMIIPSSAKTETTDELLLIKKDNYYEIVRKEEVDRLLERIEEKIESSTNVEEIRTLKEYIIEYCETIIKELSIDKQGRVSLGINTFNTDSKVKVIGARKSLIIKTKEQSL